MQIYVARHGQNEDNRNGILNGHRDLPLTPLGEQQALEAARNIIEHKLVFDAVYSSPLQRALRSAELIARAAGQPEPQIEPLLIERDFGSMTGRRVSEIDELCALDIIKTSTVTYFLSPPGAETFPELLDRANQLLTKLRVRHAADTVLLVAHGDVGKMIYAAYYQLSWRAVLEQFHFGNSELLRLSPDSSPAEALVYTLVQENH